MVSCRVPFILQHLNHKFISRYLKSVYANALSKLCKILWVRVQSFKPWSDRLDNGRSKSKIHISIYRQSSKQWYDKLTLVQPSSSHPLSSPAVISGGLLAALQMEMPPDFQVQWQKVVSWLQSVCSQSPYRLQFPWPIVLSVFHPSRVHWTAQKRATYGIQSLG